jgi:hypothetical protein
MMRELIFVAWSMLLDVGAPARYQQAGSRGDGRNRGFSLMRQINADYT